MFALNIFNKSRNNEIAAVSKALKPVASNQGIIWSIVFTCLMIVTAANAGEASPVSPNAIFEMSAAVSNADDSQIWISDIGAGFRRGTQIIGFGIGATAGLLIFSGRERHDLVLGKLSYGRVLGSLKNEGHWYQGNWEVRAELIAGGQFSPRADYVAGLAPHLCYHFATGTRLIPFIDGGAGVSLTDIGAPDLGDKFQFNLQLGTGLRWIMKKNMAFSFEGRYIHFSSAELSVPNRGVNTVGIFLGVDWFF